MAAVGDGKPGTAEEGPVEAAAVAWGVGLLRRRTRRRPQAAVVGQRVVEPGTQRAPRFPSRAAQVLALVRVHLLEVAGSQVFRAR